MTDLEKVKHDIGSLRQDFKNHQILSTKQQENTENKIDEVGKKVDRLILLLEGDPADPDRGFFKRMVAMEKFIEGLKSTKSYLSGNVAAAVFIITSIGAIISFFLTIYNFFKK